MNRLSFFSPLITTLNLSTPLTGGVTPRDAFLSRDDKNSIETHHSGILGEGGISSQVGVIRCEAVEGCLMSVVLHLSLEGGAHTAYMAG